MRRCTKILNSNEINRLQKGNSLNVMGNLIKNDEEIVVLLTYIVYSNNGTSFSSTADKKDPNKIPWLDQSGHKKTNDINQLENTNNSPPKFILQHKEDDDTEIIELSDNDDAKGIIKNFLNLSNLTKYYQI